MRPKTNQLDDWQTRARQNLRAAMLLVARHPPLVYPAISRLYYATFQATLAALGPAAGHVAGNHGDVWEAADRLRPGLGNLLRDLYKWRRCADYAAGSIRLGEARGLVSHYTTICASIGILPEDS